MPAPLHRSAVASLRTLAALAAILFLAAPCARAVIVRGTVTDPLGAAVAGARVQLIQGKSAIAASLTGPDGSFEIRSTAPGRFLLLTSSRTFTPNIGQDFYGGRTDVVTNQGEVDDLLSTHYRVTGPRRAPGDLPPGVEVIEASHTDRQSTLVVRSSGPIDDPALAVEQITLEDLVLAYMAQATTSSRPTLEHTR